MSIPEAPGPFSAVGAGLVPVHGAPRLASYLRRTYAARDFAVAMAWSRVKSSTSRTRLGALWLVLSPLLEGMAYFLVFGVLLQTGRGVENFLAYLVVGIFVFRFVSKTLTSVARSVESNRKLVRTLVHPTLVMPLSEALETLMGFVPAVVVMLVIVWSVPPGEVLSPTVLLVVPAVLLGWLFALGAGLALARLLHGVRDIANVLPFATRLWLFTSAVFYGVERFEPGSVLRATLEANPAFVVMDLARGAVLDGDPGSLSRWGTASIWAVSALVVGLLAYRSAETRYAGD